VKARNRRGATALLLAAENGFTLHITEMLLDKGADVNAADLQGNTGLMLAAAGNSPETVRVLLDHKADVNLANKNQKNALLLTSEGGHRAVAELLLAKGANVRARDAEGLTALLLACKEHYAQDDLVKLLLAKGAEANARDKDGNTALLLAAKAGAFQVVESLIRGGVDVNAKNKEGVDALRQVKESKESWTLQENGPLVRAETIATDSRPVFDDESGTHPVDPARIRELGFERNHGAAVEVFRRAQANVLSAAARVVDLHGKERARAGGRLRARRGHRPVACRGASPTRHARA